MKYLSMVRFAGPSMNVLVQYDSQTPLWVSQTLRKFGINRYGQPTFRIIWSEGRLEQVLLYTSEYGWQQRYPGSPSWILEKWLPTGYSREQWYELFGVQVSDPVSSELGTKSYLGPI